MANPKLYAGQRVMYNGMELIIDEVAPETSRNGSRYIAHERGVTLKRDGGDLIWAYREEVTPIEEEEPLMTTQTVTAADLLVKLEAIAKEVAKLVAQEKAGKPSGRQRVIEKAKEEVEWLSKNNTGMNDVHFHVNERKGTVVALIVGAYSGSVNAKGIAKVSRGDKFDEHIGKVIALRRALGRDDEPTYLNAPQY